MTSVITGYGLEWIKYYRDYGSSYLRKISTMEMRESQPSSGNDLSYPLPFVEEVRSVL